MAAIYVFDSGPFIQIFSFFYESTFPGLWKNFYQLIEDGQIISVKEVEKEITAREGESNISEWAKKNKNIFLAPTEEEMVFVSEIFKVKHFQALISRQNLLKGLPVADPFVIAKAKALNACVVTTEDEKPNAAKIPNICKQFKIDCMNLEGFMKKEKWIF